MMKNSEGSSIGKSGFRFEIWISNLHSNPKTDLNPGISVFGFPFKDWKNCP